MRAGIIGGGLAAAAIGLAVLLGAAAQPAAAPKIATVDILGLAERYLEKPELAKLRTDTVNSWQTRLQGMQAELKGIQDQGQILTPSDPKMKDLSAQFEQKRAAYADAQQQAQAEVDALAAKHLSEAYTALRTAATRIAQERGYTMVISSRAQGDITDTRGSNYIAQEMLARPVLAAPAGDDLTADVVTALSLPAAPAAPAGEIPPVSGGQK